MGGIFVDENSGEIKDNLGSTEVFTGTATTTPANVPTVADKIISGFGINNTGSQSIEVSMDGGTTFYTIKKSIFFSWNVKGEILQLVVQTPSGTTDYEMIINFEE